MKVDPSMEGKTIRVKWCGSIGNSTYYSYIRFLDENKNVLSSVSAYNKTIQDVKYTVPARTRWIRVDVAQEGSYGAMYEIQSANEPTFSTENGYMLLHADPTKIIRTPYQMIKINYFPTSVQRLYRIGTTGDWMTYLDQPIKVNQGQILYAKGIDQYGNETRIISSYTANVSDSLGMAAYDGNDSTYVKQINVYMKVDPSMEGKMIRVKWCGSIGNSTYYSYIRFLDENKKEISNISAYNKTIQDKNYTVPVNTRWIKVDVAQEGSYGALYEITPKP